MPSKRKPANLLNCLTDNPDAMKMINLWKTKWTKDDGIKKYYGKDTNAFISLFERVTGKMLRTGVEFKDTDFVKFEMAIDRLSNDMKSGGPVNSLVKWAFLSEALASKNPTAHKFYENLRVANNYQRRHHQEMTAGYNKIMKALFTAGDIYGFSQKSGKELGKELREREEKYTASWGAAHDKAKTENLTDKEREDLKTSVLDKQLKGLFNFFESEGAVFEDFRRLVEGETTTQEIQQKYLKNTAIKGRWTQEYVNELQRAKKEWGHIQKDSKMLLMNGITEVMRTVSLKFGKDSRRAMSINEKYAKIRKDLKGAKAEYMPHYLLDMIQETTKLKDRLNEVHVDKSSDSEITKIVRKLDEISIVLSKRLSEKGKISSEYFSRNPALYITRYINDVARFNFNSYMDANYVEAMRELMVASTNDRIYLGDKDPAIVQDGVQKTALAFADLIGELHSVATAGVPMEEGTRKIVRIITALEFTSKMGLSARGAMRNATQSLQNYVYFSHKIRKDSKEWMKGSSRNQSIIKEEMAKHGLLFEDISKVTEGALSEYDINKDINVDYTDGQLSYNQDHKVLNKIVEVTTKAADISSVMTKYVENYNRKSTFTIAFADMHRRLEVLPEFSPSGKDAKAIEKDNGKMRRLAGNHAAAMVEKIHFEYSPWAKSKWHRSAAGAVTGQFQHYALAFINYQANIVRDAGRAVRAGDWNGPEIGRTVRLAMLYGIGAGFSAATNAGFTHLLQNDTYERGKHLYDYFFGDEDVKKEAFFGKGPLVGMFAGPLPSDIITWINIGFVKSGSEMLDNMSEVTQVLTGLQDWSDITDEELMDRGKRTLSPALTRFWGDTKPALTTQGSLSKAFLIETGLYPRKWTSDWHERIWSLPFFKTVLGIEPPGKKKKGKKKKKKKKDMSASKKSFEKALKALKQVS